MNVTKRSNQRVIISIVMALMIALSMMPGLAFAQSVVAGYDVAIENPGTVLTGTTATMNAAIIQPSGTTVHIDWSSSDKNVATVGQHKANLTPKAAGTTTITATLREGEAPAGDGTPGQECTGAILATDSITLTVQESTAYGFQGTGGNSMKMMNPSNIIGGALTTSGYNNFISDAMALTNRSCNFTFTMSAGMNNFQQAKFEANSLPYIKVLDTSLKEVSGATVTYVKNNATDKTITISANGLTAGNYYIVKFGEQVCGNNADRNLGVPVYFTFVTK